MTRPSGFASNDVGLANAFWRKSSHSTPNGQCVEVAAIPGVTGIRDSKLGQASPVLPFAAARWSMFLAEVKNGTYDVRLPG